MYTVYVLFSEKSKKFYKGFTSDLNNRLLSHNSFAKEWTAKYRPWKLIYSRDFKTKTEALKFEKWLKSGSGRDYIKKLNDFHRHKFISAAADGSSSLLPGTKALIIYQRFFISQHTSITPSVLS